jgi:hypothetical protein
MDYDAVLKAIREARYVGRVGGTREMAMVLIKLDEAEMWCQRAQQLPMAQKSGGGQVPEGDK